MTLVIVVLLLIGLVCITGAPSSHSRAQRFGTL